MAFSIAVLPGDGIGPEVTGACISVLETVGQLFHHQFSFTEAVIGGAALDACGHPLPDSTLAVCRTADAVLLGAVGGPKWEHVPPARRPETGLLGLRAGLKLYANLRPARLYACLSEASPLKESVSGGSFDFVIVRELIGGLYFGARGRDTSGAFDTMTYSEEEIARVGRRAFVLARARRGKLTSVDKANVLETSRLWREVMHRLRGEYPDVAYEDMLVDNAAMQLVRQPGAFDVLVTENMFGDILSDEAGMITGSIGLLPSASLGDGSLGLYEPAHGSAPDIAGQNKANPIAAILSCALMLRHSLGQADEAALVEKAVETVLFAGAKTTDMTHRADEAVGTSQMGGLIVRAIRDLSA